MHSNNVTFKNIRVGPLQSFAGGIQFNGTDSYLSQTNNVISPVNTAESISIWFKSSGGSFMGLGGTDRDYRTFYTLNDDLGRVDFEAWDDGSYHRVYSKDVTFEDNVYTHIVINRPTALTAYKDGVSIGNMTITYNIGSTTGFTASNFEIGRAPQPIVRNDVYYEGTISNLTIDDGFTTAQQAADLFNQGLNGSPMSVSGLNVKAWYPFQGDANDHSGNNHHFTTVNNVTFL